MQHVSILTICKSNYAFVDAQKTDVGVHMVQKLMFKLGKTEPGKPDTAECKAVVCKVQVAPYDCRRPMRCVLFSKAATSFPGTIRTWACSRR